MDGHYAIKALVHPLTAIECKTRTGKVVSDT
jgi:hypothetical protein